MFSHISFYTFGFALAVVLLLFYVLCSKEAQNRSKPISFVKNPRHRAGSVPVQRWEEAVYFPRFSARPPVSLAA
ncbi:MAG TPA: hypothetical protein VHB20_06715 [Verrucomicrobiae bacterium]|jgi:hypothetical protein|nr:hypothetical protein [Verrucomicrobiae bacterium]